MATTKKRRRELLKQTHDRLSCRIGLWYTEPEVVTSKDPAVKFLQEQISQRNGIKNGLNNPWDRRTHHDHSGPCEDGNLYIEDDQMLGHREMTECDNSWNTDEYCDDSVQGVVLDFSRGKRKVFLAGCMSSSGEGITIDREVWDDLDEAKYAANGMAEADAEEQREYNRIHQLEHDIEELREELAEERRNVKILIAGLRAGTVDMVYQAVMRSLEVSLEALEAKRHTIASKQYELP